MKHILLLPLFIAAFAFALQAQSADDFESYMVGSGVSGNGAWTTWGGSPDGVVSDDFASSGVNSLLATGGGTVDIVYDLDDKVSGTWNLSMKFYVPSGNSAYYNIQHSDPNVTPMWASEAYFNTDGTGSVNAGATGVATFNYTQDSWVDIEQWIDIDADTTTLTIGGTFVHGWKFSDEADAPGNTPVLAAINIYPDAATSTWYIDDVSFTLLGGCSGAADEIFCDVFEQYDLGYIGAQNPQWNTWSNAPGTPEDALVTDFISNSGNQSLSFEGGIGQDVILLLGDLTGGEYELSMDWYIPAGKSAYFNIQHFEVPAIEWASEVYFNIDGTTSLNAEVTGVATGTFPVDTWFTIYQTIDMNNDLAELWIDGVLLHSWPFSAQANDPLGTPQLGGINFYPPDADALWYVDNVLLKQTAAAQVSVTFQVDMNQQTVSANGVHVAGNFQAAAGFPGDWDPSTTEMTDADGDGVYEYTASIPAGIYEYKFINGNAWGDDEAVPAACATNNNRAYDAMSSGAIDAVCYGECGPCAAATFAVTFQVDMSDYTVSANGVHIAGNFQAAAGFPGDWDPSTTELTDPDGDMIYTVTVAVPAASYTYKFINGNAWGDDESVPEECGVDNGLGAFDRGIDVTTDATTDLVCFGYCVDCSLVNATDVSFEGMVKVYPNPTANNAFLEYEMNETTDLNIEIYNTLGQVVYSTVEAGAQSGIVNLPTANLANGIYIVRIDNGTSLTSQRLTIEK